MIIMMSKIKKIKPVFVLICLLMVLALIAIYYFSNEVRILPETGSGTTYYVSTTGNDTNVGTSDYPFKTVQKCLEIVKAGETCSVQAGIYNISSPLVLKSTGDSTVPVTTIKCETAKACTIISSSSLVLVTEAGKSVHRYTIDGFRLTLSSNSSSNPSCNGGDCTYASVNFAYNTNNRSVVGNHGFSLINSYVEGVVYFWGSNNLVQNCEINGLNKKWSNGLIERSSKENSPTQNNRFINNVIHDFSYRGGWSLQNTRNTAWEGNTIYNIGVSGGLAGGIDCDGAGTADYGCNIRGNTFYNIINEAAIMMENGFESIIENNIIHDSTSGIYVINYNKAYWVSTDKDYANLTTNTIIRNNLLYNISRNGLLCKSVKGNQFINNTLYRINTSNHYFGAIGLSRFNASAVPCSNWTISNNVVSQSPQNTVYLEANPAPNMNNNWYDVYSGTMSESNSILNPIIFVNKDGGNFHLLPCRNASNGIYFGAYPCVTSNPTSTPSIATITPTNTPTIIRTNTPTPSRIPTQTPTRTATPTPTRTPTRAPTSTPTRIPTSTPTKTFTPTPSRVPTLIPTTTVKPLIPGDIYGPAGVPDGKVDIYDYTYVIGHYRKTGIAGFTRADMTGEAGVPDGKVDIYDYTMLIANYGKTQ